MDLEALIAPISGDNPVGSDPRKGGGHAAIYFEIKDSRAAARDIERQTGAVDPNEAQIETAGVWRKVIELAPKLLKQSTKDLEVACWYAEALTRFDGFAGLANGLMLVKVLIEQYWDKGLYPHADEDGDETRVAPVAALNGRDGPGTLIRPIKLIAFTAGVDTLPLAFWQYEQAVANSKVTDAVLQQRVADGAVTLENFKRAIAQTPTEKLKGEFNDISEAIAQFRAICAMLSQKAPGCTPPSSNVIGVLEDIQRAIRSMAPNVAESELAAMSMDEHASPVGKEAANGASARGGGPISNREDALQKILQIAEFFERTEPTSMAPMSLREVVRRARLPLHELLQELLQDDPAARDKVFSRAGIRSSPGANVGDVKKP